MLALANIHQSDHCTQEPTQLTGACLLQCFADKQLADMRRHPPWVMKDPRMALTMKFWRPKLRNPICLFAFKDPLGTTMSLSQNAKKSASLST